MLFDNDTARWRAVCERRADADGAFVFSVRTTGVYCRPSCPSRRARRDNVAFHDTPSSAEQRGFRACLRCLPRDVSASAAAVATLASIARFVIAHANETITLAQLARRAGLSTFHGQRSFKATFGISPKHLQTEARVERFKRQLRAGRDVLTAAMEAGFSSTSRLYDALDKRLAMSARSYRSGGAGERVGHRAFETEHGFILVGATERGPCFVDVGEDREALLAALSSEFHQANCSQIKLTDAEPWRSYERSLASKIIAPHRELPDDLRRVALRAAASFALREDAARRPTRASSPGERSPSAP
ncbi:MAG: helix-turn-helix domain-containing protein [Myxococcales bacterium]|nr:helix-turn-helix domain-containing protein [Myxococcales bacterium]